MAFFQVLAVDLDGTLASGSQLSQEALAAIDEARRNGLVIVLVSGRIQRPGARPEGDHLELQKLSQVAVVDARHYLPEPSELVDTLHPRSSIVADLPR